MSKLRVMLVQGRDKQHNSAMDFSNNDIEIASTATEDDDLIRLISTNEPEVVIVNMVSPNPKILACLRQIQNQSPRPMVMFCDDDNPDSIREAIRAGVSAYVVEDVTPKRGRTILHAAIARFEQFHELSLELEQTRCQLIERKAIERAKGLIMKQRKLSEPEAFKFMRDTAMSQNQKLKDVADNIISAAELLGTT